MLLLCSPRFLVTVTIKNRKVTVKGPRGVLSRDLSHLRVNLFTEKKGDASVVKVELWFGNRLGLATLRTVLTHIENMIVGVTKGYLFKMKVNDTEAHTQMICVL